MNVGASAPEEVGLYCSWGNTEGHEEGSGYDFSQATYDATAAAAIDSNLSLAQDMARANLGEPWRMPTLEDFNELVENCTHELITRNGVSGLLFTSNINGNTIFFPAAGLYNGTTLDGRGENGYYWSSSYYSTKNANLLYFDISELLPDDDTSRHYGFPVRAVQG